MLLLCLYLLYSQHCSHWDHLFYVIVPLLDLSAAVNGVKWLSKYTQRPVAYHFYMTCVVYCGVLCYVSMGKFLGLLNVATTAMILYQIYVFIPHMLRILPLYNIDWQQVITRIKYYIVKQLIPPTVVATDNVLCVYAFDIKGVLRKVYLPYDEAALPYQYEINNVDITNEGGFINVVPGGQIIW